MGVRRRGWGVLGLLVAALAGCGSGSGVPLAPVSGTVTWHGRPVRAEVIFQPVTGGRPAGRPATAISDSSGSYRLMFSPEESGAMIGSHQVLVTVFPYADEGEPGSFAEASKPLKQARFQRTVVEGDNQFHFALRQ